MTFRQGADKVTLNEELGDTWYELGIGANWNVTESTYVYADFNYTDGGEVESPWRWSVGVRMVGNRLPSLFFRSVSGRRKRLEKKSRRSSLRRDF